jgi:CyaY protein
VEEREFLAMADGELERLEAALERLHAATDGDWDYEMKPGGILELEFADDSKIIINRHTAAREIWIAARSGGFHFLPPESSGGQWLDSRTGERMATVLGRCMSEQAGENLQPDW